MYAQGLTALGHVLVNQGWDGGAVSRSGGVAYTMGYAASPTTDFTPNPMLTRCRDYQLALKFYLRAIEMATPPAGSMNDTAVKTREWWGVRQVISFAGARMR
jgi:hypothetical protein